MTNGINIPELETLSYKPTIAELEKAIGTPNEPDIMPSGKIKVKVHTIECICNASKQPASAPREGKEKTTLDIEPETGAENKESVGQPQQPKCKTCGGDKWLWTNFGKTGKHKAPCPDCSPEQPNQQIMLIKAIQGLTTAILYDISKLPESTLKDQAYDDMNIFETGILFKLQKEYE